MALDQNEIQELLELFPNSKAAIERFTNAQPKQKEALNKLTQKIKKLKENLSELKVKKAEERSDFKDEVNNLIDYEAYYSSVEVFIAKHSLNQVDIDDLIDEDDDFIESEDDIREILMNAWLENYDDSEIKSLESMISDLQKLKDELTA